MKKFLFTSLITNDLGLLTRSLPIARELRTRGHQVAFCNPAKAPSKVISEAGFENLPYEGPLYYLIAGNISLPVLYRVFRSGYLKRDLGYLLSTMKHQKHFSTADIWNIDHFTFLMGGFHTGMVRDTVDNLISVIHTYNPDAVVDFWNAFACIGARACHKPLITVIQADMHPQSRGFMWWKDPPDDIPSPVAVINEVLEEHRLHHIEKTGELYVGNKTLVVGMPETDPLPNTANITYIGPVLWQRENERLPDWFMDLSTTKPVIWLYPGNPQYIPGIRGWADSSVVASACVAALKDKPFQVVFSTGHHPVHKEARPLPPNFRHAVFVPGLDMAARSDLMIHHGGYGSCQTGLFTGTPSLVIPTYSERESNARRVAAAGAGDFVSPTSDDTGKKKQVNAAEVSDKVNHILSEPSFRENAGRLSKELRKYGGASYAASLIEEFV